MICFLYSKDEETRKTWEFYLPNYFEQLGLFGKVMNFVFAVFFPLVFLDMFYCRVFEAEGRVDYLTIMETVKEGKIEWNHGSQLEIEILRKHENKFLFGMKTKLMILNNSIIMMYWSCNSYHLIGCPLFLFNERPDIVPGILAVVNMLLMCVVHYYGVHFELTIYVSYIMAVEYLSARIESVMNGLKEGGRVEDKITRVLLQYNQLMKD